MERNLKQHTFVLCFYYQTNKTKPMSNANLTATIFREYFCSYLTIKHMETLLQGVTNLTLSVKNY